MRRPDHLRACCAFVGTALLLYIIGFSIFQYPSGYWGVGGISLTLHHEARRTPSDPRTVPATEAVRLDNSALLKRLTLGQSYVRTTE